MLLSGTVFGSMGQLFITQEISEGWTSIAVRSSKHAFGVDPYFLYAP